MLSHLPVNTNSMNIKHLDSFPSSQARSITVPVYHTLGHFLNLILTGLDITTSIVWVNMPGLVQCLSCAVRHNGSELCILNI